MRTMCEANSDMHTQGKNTIQDLVVPCSADRSLHMDAHLRNPTGHLYIFRTHLCILAAISAPLEP